jgi:hypothetical protein
MLALLAATSFAQTASGDESVFAPFVSRLRLATRDPQVRITWEDAPDLEATYSIYRSNESITNETLDRATLVGEAEAGDEAFLDVPDEPGSYHYAVLAQNEAGAPYRILIPGRNSSFRPVIIANLATPREEAARIVDINATVEQGTGQSAIRISAEADRDGRELVVYRSTTPIQTVDDLENASLVDDASSDEINVVDYPVPGVGYYYAIFDRELLLAGDAEVVVNENATADASEIPIRVAATPGQSSAPAEDTVQTDAAITPAASQPATGPQRTETAAAEELDFEFADSDVRAIPLPFLQLQSVLSTGRTLQSPGILIPDEVPLQAATTETVNRLIRSLPTLATDEPRAHILIADHNPEPSGAEFTLRTILDGPISRLAWEEALMQLDNFLTLPLTGDLEARAHYYRGQAYYFTGERQLAILEFLLARDRYYVEVEAWLDTILSAGA